jgi:hypothetical protein
MFKQLTLDKNVSWQQMLQRPEVGLLNIELDLSSTTKPGQIINCEYYAYGRTKSCGKELVLSKKLAYCHFSLKT